MIRGTKKKLENRPAVEMKLKAAIHNRFDFEVVDAKTGELKSQAFAENIILNSLWTYMETSSISWFSYIHYGSGKTTPTPTDTSLTNFVAALSAGYIGDEWDEESGVYSVRKSAKIQTTEAVGAEISEVGIARDNNKANLMTKALLKDMNGNPVSILKTDTDIINIYATVFVHVNPDGYQNGSCKVLKTTPSTTSFLSLLAGISSTKPNIYFPYGGELDYSEGLDTTLLVGGVLGITPAWKFSAATRSFTFDPVRIADSAGNAKGGVSYVSLAAITNNDYYRQVDILLRMKQDGWFSGSTITGEAIGTGDGVTKDFKTKFGFVENAKVFVDGVEASCQIDTGAPSEEKRSFAGKMRCIDKDGNPTCQRASSLYNSTPVYWENPYYETIGIETVVTSLGRVYASTDLSNWQAIVNSSSQNLVASVPATYRNYRYWQFSGYNSPGWTPGTLHAIYATSGRETNIHFDTPPAPGAVITADYTTPVIAKDENHVFDFSMTIQLGEFNPDA